MPNTRNNCAVGLEFTPGPLVQTKLSGAAFTGDFLWVVGDEPSCSERLRHPDPCGSEQPVGLEVLLSGLILNLP